MPTIEYKDSILVENEDAEICPDSAIVRYWFDSNNWVEVTVGERGIEIRSEGGQMVVQPISGNLIEVYLRERL